nr:MAG TPA: hypothetical protein [Ackermannviridae sp.]
MGIDHSIYVANKSTYFVVISYLGKRSSGRYYRF